MNLFLKPNERGEVGFHLVDSAKLSACFHGRRRDDADRLGVFLHCSTKTKGI